MKDLHRLKAKGWRKIFQAKGRGKKAGVEILISDKIDFKTKAIERDTERHFIIIKGRIHQEDEHCKHAPNIGAPKYIEKILEVFKKDIDSNTMVVGVFNTSLSTMDRSFKQRINKDIVALKNVPDQVNLTDTEPFTPEKQDTHSFQMHMEHFRRQTT